MLARGQTLDTLARDGIALASRGASCLSHVDGHPPRRHRRYSFDLALVAVRQSAPGRGNPAHAGRAAGQQHGHNAERRAGTGRPSRRRRVRSGDPEFPGVGGYPRRRWRHRVHRDPATAVRLLAGATTRRKPPRLFFRSAGFAVAATAEWTDELRGPCRLHGRVGAAIGACGGDAVTLAADRGGVSTMIRSVGEGFPRPGQPGRDGAAPRPLKMIFTVVPGIFAVRYWQGQLPGNDRSRRPWHRTCECPRTPSWRLSIATSRK